MPTFSNTGKSIPVPRITFSSEISLLGVIVYHNILADHRCSIESTVDWSSMIVNRVAVA